MKKAEMQGCHHGEWSDVLRPIFLLYSPKCLEVEFCELRLEGVLGISLRLRQVPNIGERPTMVGSKDREPLSLDEVLRKRAVQSLRRLSERVQ
jgi:hypothetical protein